MRLFDACTHNSSARERPNAKADTVSLQGGTKMLCHGSNNASVRNADIGFFPKDHAADKRSL